MNKDIVSQEKAYTTKDLSDMLNIAVPTVRKYAQALEKNNYTFIRDKHQNRLYVEKDVIAMQYFKNFRETKSLSVDMAAKAVTARMEGTSTQSISPIDTNENAQYIEQYKEEIKELRNEIAGYKEMMGEQNKLLQKVLLKMDEQQKYIDSKLEDKEANILHELKNHVRELPEPQTDIESTNSLDKTPEKKIGFLKRLFRS